MAKMQPVAGTMAGGMPYLSIGSGPPLLELPGLTPEHTNPTGSTRWFELRRLQPLARSFTVYLVNRKPGLSPGSSMSDLADHYAAAIEAEFGEPVPVEGVSTGGSVGLRLAVDHPHLVRRLVVVAAACRLSDEGRRVQRTLADLTAAGEPRRAWASFGSVMGRTAVTKRLTSAFMWMWGAGMNPADPSDMLATLAAEDGFDVTDDLHRITAPTLVVGGERDPLYSPELFRKTAEDVADGRLFLCRGKGHIGSVSDSTAAAEIERFLRS